MRMIFELALAAVIFAAAVQRVKADRR